MPMTGQRRTPAVVTLLTRGGNIKSRLLKIEQLSRNLLEGTIKLELEFHVFC